MRQGYHQIEVAEESRKFTAFVLPSDHYEYLRIPFGLTNAPRVFQRAMKQILGHLPYIRIFLDDISVFSENEVEHSRHLNEILDILCNNNLIISFEKSSYSKPQ